MLCASRTDALGEVCVRWLGGGESTLVQPACTSHWQCWALWALALAWGDPKTALLQWSQEGASQWEAGRANPEKGPNPS